MATRVHLALLVLVAFAASGCSPGWEAYADQYSEVVEYQAGLWEGDETVWVALGAREVEVGLAGLETVDYKGEAAVALDRIVIQAGLTETPASFRFDFTATDGYNLLAKRHDDPSLLPGWDELQGGVVYRDGDTLSCGWTVHPWGSAESAYRIKSMDGGRIDLLQP